MTLKELDELVQQKKKELAQHHVKLEDVDVIISAATDGILDIQSITLEESDSEEYVEHARVGGQREFSCIIEGA